MGRIRAAFILAGFFLTAAFIAVPVQSALLALRLPLARQFPVLYYRFLCRMMGIRIERHGTMVAQGPLLIAANHTSYFDVVVLGALGPISFIAKSEVRRWPFFGLGAELTKTIFVDRARRQRAQEDRAQIQERLCQGDSLVLFPEGTSSNGNGILPFKSALLSVAESEPAKTKEGRSLAHCRVQPVSISYTRLNGLPMGRISRPLFAWYGDMSLMPHLWAALAAGPFDVTVQFHAPVTPEQFGDRKMLARHCETVVREGVALALSGRPVTLNPVFMGAGAPLRPTPAPKPAAATLS